MREDYRQRLCLSGFFDDISANYSLTDDFEFVEIRCDEMLDFSPLLRFIREGKKTILTYKEAVDPIDDITDTLLDRIILLINLKPYFVDIPFFRNTEKLSYLLNQTRKNNVLPILSVHLSGKPANFLDEFINYCSSFDSGIIKIVFPENTSNCFSRLDELYSFFPSNMLLCFVAGDSGKESRLKALDFGAPFTFVSSEKFKPTGSGQINFEELL